MDQTELQVRENVIEVVKTLHDKKASDIKVLTVKDLTSVTDYFIICTGNSNTQIKTLADHVEEKMGELGRRPLHVEGYEAANWVLLDYGDIVVHIFHSELRGFYSLERLWSDAPTMNISPYID
jgi:ribosome-associated protein